MEEKKSESVEVVPLESIEPYSGPHAIPGIRFRAARSRLGISAWGMNVLQIGPHNEGHPEHDHGHDGQEEVYFVVEGEAKLLVDGKALALTQGDFVRVPPTATRKIVTGEKSVTVLALGATPGAVFQASM